jgi:hypothetical protein
VEVLINGEFAMSIVEDPPLFTEIADLLQPGENTITVLLRAPEQPRAGSEALHIEIRRTETTTMRRRTVGLALAEVVIPADVDLTEPCEESVAAWIGPPGPSAGGELNERYWLFVTGPPVGVRVRVKINGTVVTDVASGTSFIDVTRFAVKGKNTVELESRPTCLDQRSARDEALTFAIGAAEQELDHVQMTETPQVWIEYRRTKRATPKTITRRFRAR